MAIVAITEGWKGGVEEEMPKKKTLEKKKKREKMGLVLITLLQKKYNLVHKVPHNCSFPLSCTPLMFLV